MNTEEVLIQKVEGIREKRRLINEKAGGYFNIFSIMRIGTDEVKICRLLYELLSPKGCHYQGSRYLKLFFEDVLRIPITEDELATANVYREYRIDRDRRIDLVVVTSNYWIPIEVKIYAQDQEKQCYDYFQKAVNSKVYYLTRYGDVPSEKSGAGLHKVEQGYEEVATISFQKDILCWLEHCISLKETIKIAPIREVLQQFIDVIHSFTGQMEDEMENEVVDLLMESSEHMKSAMAIQDGISVAKINMLKKFFQTVERKVGLDKIENEYDYAADNYKRVKEFYDHNYSTFPGISYMLQRNVKEGVDIWVRLEIDHKLYIGYCCPQRGKRDKQPLTEEEITSILKVTPRIDKWWANWEYCLLEENADYIDFKETNEAYLKLYDQEYFDKITTRCAKIVVEMTKDFLMK